MAKGLPRSLAHANKALAPIVRETLVPIGKTITIDGSGTDGWGTLIIGDFPEGNILFLGAVAYFSFAGTGSDADLADTWQGDYAIGTAPSTDHTTPLASAQEDLIVTVALAAATAEVSPRTRSVHLQSETGIIIDNTDGSLEVNLNLLIDDANIAGTDTVITVTGEMYMSYIVLGDD